MSGEKTLQELASTESDCSSARKDGDLGFFGPGQMQSEDVAMHMQNSVTCCMHFCFNN